MAVIAGNSENGRPFPGDAQLPLPSVPSHPDAIAMYTAHRVDDSIRALSHARERADLAKKAAPALRRYYLMHINNHLSKALQDGHELADNLRLHYPAEGRELDALTQTLGLARAVSANAKVNTTAHLVQTFLYHLTHSKRHAMTGAKDRTQAEWQFDYDHLDRHLDGALEHGYKLAAHLRDNYPAEWKWMQKLGDGESLIGRPGAPERAIAKLGLSAAVDGAETSVGKLARLTAGYQRTDPMRRGVGARTVQVRPYPTPHPARPVPPVAPGFRPGTYAWGQVRKGWTIQIGSFTYKVLEVHMTSQQISAANRQSFGPNTKGTRTGANTGSKSSTGGLNTKGPQATALGNKKIAAGTATSTSFLQETQSGFLYVVTLPETLGISVTAV